MKKLFLCVIVMLSVKLFANPGDTTWVQANIVPQINGWDYDSAITFPNNPVTYRKILMVFTLGEYQCPGGSQYCHQWDYLVRNFLIKNGISYELGRMVTPFATGGTPGYPSTWQQQYLFDVTDFYPLFQGTDTIQMNYQGYSGGFSANIKFAFIEGVPERTVNGINFLWNVSPSYGNPADTTNNHIPTNTLTAPASTSSAELHVLITGHGNDGTSNCCEFASKNYNVLLNNGVINTATIYRDNCGANEFYPQGGTWLYNRGNWCPGDEVISKTHLLPGVTAGNTFNVDMQLFPYADTTDTNYGYYVIEGQVFYYGACNHTLDASLDHIISPSNLTIHTRENPSGGYPVVHVRNSGSSVINSITFSYNVMDSAVTNYTWNGTIPSLHDTDITLANPLNSLYNMSQAGSSGVYTFLAKIIAVNGSVDQDTTNNSLQSSFIVAPTWPNMFIVHLNTSNMGINDTIQGSSSPSEDTWTLTDMNNQVIASRTNTYCSNQYTDTVFLPMPGFYKLTVNSLNCNGLQDQYNPYSFPGFSSGSYLVETMNANPIPMNGYNYSGSYRDDFGCFFSQYFSITGMITTGVKKYKTDSIVGIIAYPNPSHDDVNIILNGLGTSASGLFEIIDAYGRCVLQQKASGIQNQLNLVGLQNGIYTITYKDAQVQPVETRILISK